MLKTSKFKINTKKKNEMDENKKYQHLMSLFKSLIKELPQSLIKELPQNLIKELSQSH